MRASRTPTTTLVVINILLISAIACVVAGQATGAGLLCGPVPLLLLRLWADPTVTLDGDVLIVERGDQRVTMPLADVVAVERVLPWPFQRHRLCFSHDTVLGEELAFDLAPRWPWSAPAAPLRAAVCRAHQRRGAIAQRRALDARYDSEPTEIMSRRMMRLPTKGQAHV